METALNGAVTWAAEQPIVEEIFSIERLELLAARLASEQQVSAKPTRGQRLLPRFEDNGRRLVAAYRTLVDSEQDVSPAAARESTEPLVSQSFN